MSEWKRRVVDNGYNADWKCKKCGYVVHMDFPPEKCSKCEKEESEATNETDNPYRLDNNKVQEI